MPLHKYAHTLIQKNAYMQAFIYTQICLHRYVFRYTSIQIYYMQKLTYTCIYSTHKREYIPAFVIAHTHGEIRGHQWWRVNVWQTVMC